MKGELDYRAVLAKIEEMKKGRNFDLSNEEDLAIAIMNLVSLEEHFFFTGAKTDKPEYFDLLTEVRAMRTKLLGRMIEKTEGESWCIGKHLLAASMRLFEVGTKLQSADKHDEAKETFALAYKLFTMFFAVRLKVVDASKLHMKKDEPMTIQDIMTKLVDCCKE
ncbi:MAG: hypothetical protein KGH93_03380 [Patescibacteria group bacterium]|nr:hypothetical protein [Patescibacteria group bacterium]MDE1946207.1 hypothetical protein [Patescibacteria group bacterium]